MPGGRVIHVDARYYFAHPHMAVLPDGSWLMVANRAPRRAVTLHPPHDPDFCNVLLRSHDEGETWSEPVPVPGGSGTECAGLTVLKDGAVLLNQWRFRWYIDEPPDEPVADAAALRRERFGSTELESGESCIAWSRGGGEATASRSADGINFDVPVAIEVAPYSGGYGMRGAAVLEDGAILLPLSDAPHYKRVFAVLSTDGGRHWSAPEPIAEAADRDFEEPAPLVLPDGTILLLLRDNVSHTLHSVRSDDGGRSWSAPSPAGITGYPAHLLRLPDGRLIAIVGQRTPPLRIAAFVSRDRGLSWDLENPFTVASPPHRDLGYPTAALRSDGSVFVAWYQRDAEDVTGLHCASLTL